MPPSLPKSAPSSSTPRTRASPRVLLSKAIEYLTNRQIIFKQEIYCKLEALRIQQQNKHSQTLDLLQGILLSTSPSPASTALASPPSPPHPPTDHPTPFTPSTNQSTPTVIPFIDISSPATSLIPPTPPISLVTPLPHPGLMLSTPTTSLSHFAILFQIPTPSPTSTLFPLLPTPTQLQVNLARSPFIGILPGASTEVFLAPKPLRALYSSTTSSSSIFRLVVLTPLDQAEPITPLSTLPPLLISGPSLSNLPHLSTLSFTLQQIHSSQPPIDSTFSTFPTAYPSSSEPVP